MCGQFLTAFNNYACDKIHLKTINLITIINSTLELHANSHRARFLFSLRQLITYYCFVLAFAIARECTGTHTRTHGAIDSKKK